MAKVGKFINTLVVNIPMFLVMIGLGLISFGAFQIYGPIGYIAAGLALILAAWIITPDKGGE